MKNNIKVSHESPLCLLEESRQYNDYDYALVHLFETYPKYFTFFKQSINIGRQVILDNSIFELNKSFNSALYYNWIQKLNPTDYIVPDILENSLQTIKQFKLWMEQYGNKCNNNKIGVVQGKTYKDIVKCYNFMNIYADKIAISFDYSYYLTQYKSNNIWINYMLGRINLLNKLIEDNIINYDKKHHLLGVALPQEVKYYNNKKFKFIDSIDTSNPIVHGIKNIQYDNNGLLNKETIMLADLIDYPKDKINMDIVKYNIYKFKQFIEGT